jgi:hypothetical protein
MIAHHIDNIKKKKKTQAYVCVRARDLKLEEI